MFWVESFSGLTQGSPFRDLFVHDYLHRSRSTNAGPILIGETKEFPLPLHFPSLEGEDGNTLVGESI